MSPREIAYLSYLNSLRDEQFISDTLDTWIKRENPSAIDKSLAREIASGTMQRRKSLDFFAYGLSQKLSLKRKELALLHTALYQYYFMDRIPTYALVNESVAIAKKYCHTRFAKFLNAFLRKLKPQDLPIDDLSIYYSHTPYFVEQLIEDYGVSKAKSLLELSNQAPVTMVRKRPGFSIEEIEGLKIPEFSHDKEYYIQNATPAHLMHTLAKEIPFTPKRILDLCASPGGKLIAAHDLFPEATLFANDLSEKKIDRLKANLEKYEIEASLSVGQGENYTAKIPFDLIILDVPCSNSGVLNKRAEARWRLTKKEIEELKKTQKNLLDHALTLLGDRGEIWYLTCSILKEENERLISQMDVRVEKTVLPNEGGWDGGFGAALTHL